MDLSLKDSLVSRLQLVKDWILMFAHFAQNPFTMTSIEYSNKINGLKKQLFIIQKTHEKYFGAWGAKSIDYQSRLTALKRFFFNPKFGMTIMSQSSVKIHYDPYFNYLSGEKDVRPEQMSCDPMFAFQYLRTSKPCVS